MANNITQWKPQVTLNILECGRTKPQTTSFDTYREVQKNMKLLLERSSNNEVCVSRSKRGEWGEWFERWQLQGGKPVIIKACWL